MTSRFSRTASPEARRNYSKRNLSTLGELATRPAGERLDGIPRAKKCRGECGKTFALNDTNFPKNARGGFRSNCRKCTSKMELERQRDLKARGVRRCVKCGTRRSVCDFAVYVRNGERQLSQECDQCNATPPTVLDEAELLQQKNVRRHLRWAISLQILLGRRNMTMAQFLALKPDARRELEARWSELMREMANDVGELVVVIDPLMQGRERVPEESLVTKPKRERSPNRIRRAAA